MHGSPRQFRPQFRARVDESRAGDMQPHDFHHHLVRICSAVKGTGARTMIRRSFRLKQFGAAHFTLGIKLPHALLFLVG